MTWAQAVLLIGTVLIVAFGSSCERERISVNDDEWEQVIPELPLPTRSSERRTGSRHVPRTAAGLHTLTR